MSDGVDDMDKENFRSLRGALFFGVPCQGMNIQSLIPMFPERARQALLHSLDHTNSPTLHMLGELYDRKMSSREDFQCLNFYETMASPTAIKVGTNRDSKVSKLSRAKVLTTPRKTAFGQ